MTKQNQDFEVYQGDSHNLIINIENQDDDLKPLNLAGAELTWTLYQEPTYTPKITKTTEMGGVFILNASEGTVKVELRPFDTESLRFGTLYTHSLIVRNNIGQKSTVMTGNLTVKK